MFWGFVVGVDSFLYYTGRINYWGKKRDRTSTSLSN